MTNWLKTLADDWSYASSAARAAFALSLVALSIAIAHALLVLTR